MYCVSACTTVSGSVYASSFSSLSSYHDNSQQSLDYDVDRAVKEAMKGLKSVGDDARNIQQIYDEVSFNSLRRFTS